MLWRKKLCRRCHELKRVLVNA